MSKKRSPSRAFDDRRTTGQVSGISNRESAVEVSAERDAHPSVGTNPGPPEDAEGRTPVSKEVPGAFGKEHQPDESRMDRIARRAHEIYEARGGQHGKAMEDWLTAERQIDDEIEQSLIK